jgi:hypothetical protein
MACWRYRSQEVSGEIQPSAFFDTDDLPARKLISVITSIHAYLRDVIDWPDSCCDAGTIERLDSKLEIQR